MPGLARKLVIFAAVDGLVLQPLGTRRNSQAAPASALKINYDTHVLSPILIDHGRDLAGSEEKLEAHGIVGILKVASAAYLISISRRRQVAQLWGKPVYQVSDVELIPISSQKDAQRAISDALTASRLRQKDQADNQDKSEHPTGALLGADEDTIAPDSEDLEEHSDIGSLHEGHSRRPSVDDSGRRRGSIDARREAGIAEEVIGRKGAYGRFAEQWFSKRGWTTGQRRNMGMSSKEDTQDQSSGGMLGTTEQPAVQSPNDTGEPGQAETQLEDFQRWPQSTPKLEKSLDEAMGFKQPDNELTTSLLPKLVQTVKILFGSKTFYYSYDFDITRSASQQKKTPSDLPLFKQVDMQYFYNHHLVDPLIEDGYDEFVIPIMQGFVGQRSFVVGNNPEKTQGSKDQNAEPAQKVVQASQHTEPADIEETDSSERSFLLTLVSRRSIRRAGLRYLRRGIDEDGNVANSVETEQLLSTPAWDAHVQSFLQTRGSIPLFYSQTPYTFKPVPVLHASMETNQAAFRKHFTGLSARYGNVEAVSLIDHHGVEEKIGEAYESQVQLLNENGGINGNPLGFEWFDFHQVCKGMKFENVCILVQKLLPYLTKESWTALGNDGNPAQRQTGIIRTNCMDCLDRTNVVQAAFAQTILELQLASFPTAPVHINLTTDPTTSWFNSLWADNGDAISRAYAGTSALKGDYTRTRKRNAFGALNDLSLTLSRYYHNLFNDFFAQAAIDYILGTATAAVFLDFEATLSSADPAIDIHKARTSAIATATHVVVGDDDEHVRGGWALASPATRSARRAFPLHEALLLLTDAALYIVRFDWDAEKVSAYERVELERVRGVQCGAYILQTHTPAQTDPAKNAGLLVRYMRAPMALEEGPQGVEIDAVRDAWSVTGVDGHLDHEGKTASADGGHEEAFVAFKALPSRSSAARHDSSSSTAAVQPEREVARGICDEIARAVNAARAKGKEVGGDKVTGGNDGADDAELQVEVKDILGLEEARRKTGVFEQLGYSLRKFVWG